MLPSNQPFTVLYTYYEQHQTALAGIYTAGKFTLLGVTGEIVLMERGSFTVEKNEGFQCYCDTYKYVFGFFAVHYVSTEDAILGECEGVSDGVKVHSVKETISQHLCGQSSTRSPIVGKRPRNQPFYRIFP